MAMNSLACSFIRVSLFIILHLLSPVTPLYHKYLSDSNQGLLLEEKSRLGSTPPSCFNKCRHCHPCMAVQVPTLPSHDKGRRRQRLFPADYLDPSPSSPSPGNNRYSNYKPLGWKCRCGNHLYNP